MKIQAMMPWETVTSKQSWGSEPKAKSNSFTVQKTSPEPLVRGSRRKQKLNAASTEFFFWSSFAINEIIGVAPASTSPHPDHWCSRQSFTDLSLKWFVLQRYCLQLLCWTLFQGVGCIPCFYAFLKVLRCWCALCIFSPVTEAGPCIS